jgi:hypothetical protein
MRKVLNSGLVQKRERVRGRHKQRIAEMDEKQTVINPYMKP